VTDFTAIWNKFSWIWDGKKILRQSTSFCDWLISVCDWLYSIMWRI